MTEQAAPRGSSFYLAMRVLPRDQREAMLSIYTFCRGSTTSPTSGSVRGVIASRRL